MVRNTWLPQAQFSAISLACVLGSTTGTTVAAEITDLYGSWGHPQGGYNCNAQPGYEDMPVTIRKDEAGDISVGAYAWLCNAKNWDMRGAFFTAQTSCGHEGDEEITSERVELALSNDGQLVLVRDTTVDVLNRCPAAN